MLGQRLLLTVATVVAVMLAGCGDNEATPAASAQPTEADFDQAAYAAAIAGSDPALSARLESPTDDGNGDVRVEVDRRPADGTIRLAVQITRPAGRLAFETLEVGNRTYFLDGPAGADGDWIAVDRGAAGPETPRVESLLSTFPVVGDIAGSVRAEGWSERGVEPCPRSGACFVLTNPAFAFASLFIDTRTHRPVHLRLARPGMRAAGEIEIDWMATDPVKPPANAREVNGTEFQQALAPVLQSLGL